MARTDSIGDVMMSLPVFASLRKCFPAAQLTALVTGYTSDVAASCRFVDDVIAYSRDDGFPVSVGKLKDASADAILFLFPRFRLAAAAWLAGIPVRAGTAFRWYSFLFNRKVREHRKYSTRSEADYNLDVAAAVGCTERSYETALEVDAGASESVGRFLSENGVGKFFVIHPGSRGSAAEWGAANFRSLAAAIESQQGLRTVVTGVESERDLCRKVSEGIPGSINAAGRFSLLEFIALLSRAELFVSNSTGPIHVAASLGIPVAGIYPNRIPMTPTRWAPLGRRKAIITPKDDSDDLSAISVEEVLESIKRLLMEKV